MGALKIALEEGFDGQHVVVSVDGEVALDEPALRTRLQTGYARLLEIPASGGTRALEVSVDGVRRLSKDVDTESVGAVRVNRAPDGRLTAVTGGDLPG
ncbi:hypothetical protein J1792_00680 [Streptomyces triculaminicus]|uniref:Uncharacterized protein n=2 Tax=Streptomyces TaxID=1883 RepID=A0A939FHA3_9ACTN|nr:MULTISPECIES: hypothetical protein [Streptomyces]MBO0651368.1 hypothetical protein [Streptomyces triculaminicus]QSY49681.1 hypothetical protein J3S04_00675 [Streptomyces griseocarneus]